MKLGRDLTWGTHQNCHTFGWLVNDDPIHGEYNNDNVPCLTDPAMCEKLIKGVRAQIEYYTEIRGTVPEAVSLSYTDNSSYCKCENCEAINTKYESPAATLILFLNKVCEDLEKDYPDMIVQSLAYWHTNKAPVGLKAHPNVAIQYCTISSCYNHSLYNSNCYYNTTGGISGWEKVVDTVFVWDYGYNWAYYATPYPILSYEDIMVKHQELYENNVDLMFQCIASGKYGNFQQVCAYMYALAMWDPYMSEEDYYSYMKDACRGYYGDGWKSVYDSIILLEENYAKCVVSEHTITGIFEMCLGLKKYIPELLADMESARLQTRTKYQWENVDCAMMQFEYVSVSLSFDSMYNSSDPELRAEIQEMCTELYAKYLKYNLPLSNNVPNPPMPKEFEKSPHYWRQWAYFSIDPNRDDNFDDRLYDEDGNWLTDELVWE